MNSVPHDGSPVRISAGSLFPIAPIETMPACPRSRTCDLAALFWRESLCSSLATLQSARSSLGRMPCRFAKSIRAVSPMAISNTWFEYLVRKLDGITRTFALADGHGNYSLTIRSTAWFTSSRACFLAASRRLPVSFFSDRSDWRCDL